MNFYYDNKEEANRRKIDSDLASAFEYNPQEGLEIEQIKEVLAVFEGEPARDDWHWIASVKGGKFVYLTGGCDYTGWSCRSDLEHQFATTARKAILLAPVEVATQLLEQFQKGKKLTKREEVGKALGL